MGMIDMWRKPCLLGMGKIPPINIMILLGMVYACFTNIIGKSWGYAAYARNSGQSMMNYGEDHSVCGPILILGW